MQSGVRERLTKMKKLLLMSLFAGLFVLSGVMASFAGSYQNDVEKDFYTKGGRYDSNNFKGQKYLYYSDIKHADNCNDHHRFYINNRKYLKNNRYAYQYDNGYHYGHRHKNIVATIIFGTHYSSGLFLDK